MPQIVNITQRDSLSKRNILQDVAFGYSQFESSLLVYDTQAIGNMLYNILTTTPGERPFRPRFGSRIPYLLFEPINDVTAWKIETAIFDAIGEWMPYVKLDRANTRVIPMPDFNAYDARLPYYFTVGVNNVYDVLFYSLRLLKG